MSRLTAAMLIKEEAKSRRLYTGDTCNKEETIRVTQEPRLNNLVYGTGIGRS